MLNHIDRSQLTKRGISEKMIEKQIERFKSGFPTLNVSRPATIQDGIRSLEYKELQNLNKHFKIQLQEGVIAGKFVPASGAATRMFKDLYQYLENPVPIKDLPKDAPIVQFLDELANFAFSQKLDAKMKLYNLNNPHVRKPRAEEIIKMVLSSEGLNYGNLPKGLVHFHKKGDQIRTAMEDQMIEGSHYVLNNDGTVKIHFTVSSEHHELFLAKLNEAKKEIEDEYNIILEVSFSFQKPHTDTLAVTPDNEPFRDNEGELIFRPGGHGALIENLNDQSYDLIFIKNIDNIASEHLWADTIQYKNALGGLLLQIKEKVFAFLHQLDTSPTNILFDEIQQFITKEFHVHLPNHFKDKNIQEKTSFLKTYLNRPIRVCGMVKNEGEPGGGPFWVVEDSGIESLQILESSQLDIENPKHIEMIKKSTHFNPVDLVCFIKNYQGDKFDLTQFSDPQTGFISDKTFNGKPLKALELPGLWNGAMANWLTLFVEVPITTFDPVKTVNDLLKKEHQPDKQNQ